MTALRPSNQDLVIRTGHGVNGRRSDSSGLLASVIVPPDWMLGAVCAETDPELFYPERDSGGGSSTLDAKRFCSGCDVRSECLQYALEHDEEYGVWGGLSTRQRRRLKRRAA